jgi:hypothetical protein
MTAHWPAEAPEATVGAEWFILAAVLLWLARMLLEAWLKHMKKRHDR